MTHRDAFSDAIDALDDSLEVAAGVIKGLKLGVSASTPLHALQGAPCNDLLLQYDRLPGDIDDGKRHLHITDRGNVIDTTSLALKQRVARTIPSLVEALQTKRADDGASIHKTAGNLEAYLTTLRTD